VAAERRQSHGRASRIGEALFGAEPFRRLVLAEVVSVIADVLFTVSLAGSLFFSVSVSAARPRVLLYLVVTLAPFALVAPFVGPLVDRRPGGQRVFMAVSCVGRAAASVLIASHPTSLLLFPAAFAVLVLGKASSVARSALVPWLVRDDADLVAANARLSRTTTVAGGAALMAGAGLFHLGGQRLALSAGVLGYLAASGLALRIPRAAPAPATLAASAVEEVELRRVDLRLAANALSVLRAAVGFLAFLLAFNLKADSQPSWVYGVAIATAGAGGFAGTFVAAFARRWVKEEVLLGTALVAPGLVALSGTLHATRSGALVVAFAVGVGASVGRQAFNSLTQRLAPDAEKGRAFARFETEFQLAWVVGAVAAVLTKPSWTFGLAVLAVGLGGAAMLLAVGLRALRYRELIVGAHLDPAQGDLADELLMWAEALRAQGAQRMAVVTAVTAVRAASTAARLPDHRVGAELENLWREAATGTGALPPEAAERAIRLAREAVRAVCPPGGTDPWGFGQPPLARG
jgi:Na+/melibiose symporter-like transporter